MRIKGLTAMIKDSKPHNIDSSGLSDTKWWHRFGSTLSHLLPLCLTASSRYLNHYWLIIKGILWHLHKSNFPGSTCNSNLQLKLENYTLRIVTAASPRGQWVYVKGRTYIKHDKPFVNFLYGELFIVFYCSLVPVNLTHILQGHLTDTLKIIGLPQCQ